MIDLPSPRERLIYMTQCRRVSRRLIRLFLSYDSSLKKIFKHTPHELNRLFSIPLKKAKQIHQDLQQIKAIDTQSHNMLQYDMVTILDSQYPELLKQIHDPPLVLYTMGDQTLLKSEPKLSVIGTRQPSQEAKIKVIKIVQPLIEHQWTIVSGMARGVDGFAHELSLRLRGKTIAVLGGGFYHIYPREHQGLFQAIVKHGLVISEYPPDVPPARYHFPERNRIISGLSFGTLVVEAKERSGTLITVDQALDQGREVYAVPGSPFIPQTKGCHQMIQDGAKLVIDAQDILEDWSNPMMT